ncbi:hypothetical protein ACFSJ3_00350 [Corallincola platygyrae]|uniref:Glutamine amidotransferase domain-containing protein n=1 Tax=Corallincola platygyrae TaxID=1193278 RepID=A0ABW4XID8_9GAMM
MPEKLLRIAILDADHLYPELVDIYQSYGRMFEQLFAAVLERTPQLFGEDFILQTQRFDVVSGVYPESLDCFDGVLVTGSKADAFSDEAWVQQLRDYAVDLLEAKIPTAGICFGHQLLALVAGGKVDRAANGWGVGINHYQVPKAAAGWLAELGFSPAKREQTDLVLIASHQDQVLALPANAQLLAGNAFCPNAGFRIENHLLSFQGHPEFTGDYLKALMTLRRERVGEANYQKACASVGAPHHGHDIGQLMLKFFAASKS